MRAGLTLLLMSITFVFGGFVILLICMAQRIVPPTSIMLLWLIPAAFFCLSGIGVLVREGLRAAGQGARDK